MIIKWLLILLLAMGFFMMGRFARSRQALQPVAYSPEQTADLQKKRRMIIAILAVLMAGIILVNYWEWQENRRIMVIQVMDLPTGKHTRYEARRNKIFGRSFETLDGRWVTLADSERLEVTKP